MKLTNENLKQLSIFESELDGFLTQHDQQTAANANKPNVVKRAGSAVAKAATSKTVGNVATTATNVATNAANAVKDVFNTPALGGDGVVKKVDLFRPTFDRDKTKAQDQHSTFVNKDPIEDFREYAKRITKGKVAQQSTGTPEVDTLLKKLKVFKRQ
jgi:hypothetical protein